MPISKPKHFSEQEVQKAVGVVKSERPDLWKKLVERERQDEGYGDFSMEIQKVVWPHFKDIGTSNLVFLMFEVRTEARKEAGRPVG